MANFTKESQLSDPVTKWLEDQDYTVYVEIPIFNRPVDVLAVSDEKLVAVSLKLCLTQKVIYQATTASLRTDEAWCGVASNPRTSGIKRCEEQGIGVLHVTEYGVDEILQPHTSKQLHDWSPSERARQWMLKKLEKYRPGGVGGRPTGKGVGPAQAVYERVQKYRIEHSDATWEEVFENVPNHYAHARSLAGGMRAVEKRRAQTTQQKALRKTRCRCGHLGEEHKKLNGWCWGGCKVCRCKTFIEEEKDERDSNPGG